MFFQCRMLNQPLALLAGVLVCTGVQAQAYFVTGIEGGFPHDVRMVVEGIGDQVFRQGTRFNAVASGPNNGMRAHEFAVRTSALFESSCVPVVCSPETDARPFNFQRNFLLDACFSNTCPALMPPRLRVRLENANDARQVLCAFDVGWALHKYGDASAFVQYRTPTPRIVTQDLECVMHEAPLPLRLPGGIAVTLDRLASLYFSIQVRPRPSGGAAR